MDQPDGNAVEIRLDNLEEGVEITIFLACLASVFLMLSAVVMPVMAALALGSKGVPYWLVLAFSFAFSLNFFLWSSGISHIWRAPILLGAVLTGSTLAIYPISEMLQRQEFDWPAEIIFGITAFVSITFGIRIIWDGWRLARPRDNSGNMLTTVPYDRLAVGQTCARAFGVHPICRWLPSRTRRVIAALLFALATMVLAVALGLVVYLVVSWLSTGALAAQNSCMPAAENPRFVLPCAVTLFSALAGPAIVLATCLAGAASLRWLARRSARLSLQAVNQTDARPEIVFLRSFMDDQVQLVLPKRPLYRRLMALGEPAPRLDHILIEEATPTGPVVAIGLPGRPPPFGAARAYFNEDEWKSAVAKMASGARAIIVVIDDTDGILWELSHIRQAGFASKTLYLLPPHLSKHDEAARIIRREFAEPSPAHTAAIAVVTVDPELACIGWYHTGSGDLKILMTRMPTSTSYVCALRLALRPWSDNKLADPFPNESPQQAGMARERWIGPAVALAMLASLAAVVWLQVPSRASARSLLARAQFAALSTALERYRLDVGQYPTQDTGLRALVEAPPQARGWQGPYITGNTGLLDPWGRPYIYRVPGATRDFDIISLGRDGQPGGTGEDADMTNWK